MRGDGRPGGKQRRGVRAYLVLDGGRLMPVVTAGEVDEFLGEGAAGFDGREVLGQPDLPTIGGSTEVPPGHAGDLDDAFVGDYPGAEQPCDCRCERGYAWVGAWDDPGPRPMRGAGSAR